MPCPLNVPSLNSPTYFPPSGNVTVPTQFVQVVALYDSGHDGSWLGIVVGEPRLVETRPTLNAISEALR